MMSMLNLFWIVPLCVAIGYAIAAIMWMASDRNIAPVEYVDWSKIPIEYNWVCCANDEENHGLVKLFIDEPKIDMGGWYECWLHADSYAPNDAIIGPLPPWRESLRKRPA